MNIMDRKAAEALYKSGQEPTVKVLVELSATNETLKSQIAKLSKNSTNSSKPPSTDIVRKPRSLRTKSGKRSGGQPGHDGCSLEMADTADRVIEHQVKGLCTCGRDASKGKLLGHDRR